MDTNHQFKAYAEDHKRMIKTFYKTNPQKQNVQSESKNQEKNEEDMDSDEGNEDKTIVITTENHQFPSITNLCSSQFDKKPNTNMFISSKTFSNDKSNTGINEKKINRRQFQSISNNLISYRNNINESFQNMDTSSNKLNMTNNDVSKVLEAQSDYESDNQSHNSRVEKNQKQDFSEQNKAQLKAKAGLNLPTLDTKRIISIEGNKSLQTDKKSPTPSIESFKAFPTFISNLDSRQEIQKQSITHKSNSGNKIFNPKSYDKSQPIIKEKQSQNISDDQQKKKDSEQTIEDDNSDILNEDDEQKMQQKISQGIQVLRNSSRVDSKNDQYNREVDINYDDEEDNQNQLDCKKSTIHQKDSKRMQFIQEYVENEKIQRLCQSLLQRIKRKRFFNLGVKDIKLINDLSIVINRPSLKEKLCGMCLKTFTSLGNCISMIPVLNPTNFYRIWFDLFILMISCFYFFVVPIQAAFGDELGSEILPIQVNVIYTIFLLVEILLNISTSYLERGYLVFDRIKIMQRYFKQKFLQDIILLFAVYGYEKTESDPKYSQYGQIMRYMLFVVFWKVNQFGVLIRKIQDRFVIKGNTLKYIKLLRLLVLIIFISHFFACLWILTVNIEKQAGVSNTWMHKKNIADERWIVKYTSAYYFATVTMITVGFGDITPNNIQEQIVCIFTMLIACGVFAYSINSIGHIIKDLNANQEKKQTDLQIISKYMQKKNIHYLLQYEIREYLEYYWENCDQYDLENQQNIINQLSDQLKTNLLLEANKSALKDNPLFRDNFSEEFISHAVQLISEQQENNEYLYTQFTIEKNYQSLQFKRYKNNILKGQNKKNMIYFKQENFLQCNIIREYIKILQILIGLNKNIFFYRIRYTPEEFIIFEGVPDDQSIYFIENGAVEMLIRQQCLNGEVKYQTICEVNLGQFFGQVSFFTGQARSLSVRCKDFTTLLKIERQEFLNLLEKYPYDQEKFFSIKEKITFGKQFQEIGGNCYNCGDRFHQIYECPIIHYEVNKVSFLCQYRYSPEQDRKLFRRINVKFKTKSITNVKELTQLANEFVDNNYDLFENREDWFQHTFLMNTDQLTKSDDPNYKLKYMSSTQVDQDNEDYLNQDEVLQGITEEIDDSKAGNQSDELITSNLINDTLQKKNQKIFKDRIPSIVQSNDKIKSEPRVSVCDVDESSPKRMSTNIQDDASHHIYIYQALNLLNSQQAKFNTLQQILDKNIEQNIYQTPLSNKNISALDVLNTQIFPIIQDLSEKPKESVLKYQMKNQNVNNKPSSIIGKTNQNQFNYSQVSQN